MKIMKVLSDIFSSNRTPKRIFDVMQKVANIAFPRGNEQIAEEVELVYAILDGKVSAEDIRNILIKTKPLFYVRNVNRISNEIVRMPEAIQSATKTLLSENDLNLIYDFYEKYFNFKAGLLKEKFSESKTTTGSTIPDEDVDLKISLRDQNGTYWGSVELRGEKTNWIARSGESGGIYSSILFLAVSAARQKLLQADKDKFVRWAGLPQGEWREIHYSEFAFSCVSWLSVAGDEIRSNENLKQIKGLLLQCHEPPPLNLDLNQEIRELFCRTFGNN